MMLVGSLAYALPLHQDFAALLPAIAGMVMATGGMVARMDAASRRIFLRVNIAAAFLLVAFTLTHMGHDAAHIRSSRIAVIADVDVLTLAIVFIVSAMRELNRLKKRPDPYSTGLGNAG